MVLGHLPTEGHITVTRTLEVCMSVLCECDLAPEPMWLNLG